MCDVATLEEVCEESPDMVVLTGWSHCIVGFLESCGSNRVLCYDAVMIVDGLTSQGMTHEDAWEYFDFNIAGGYYGEHTPKFLYRTMPVAKPQNTSLGLPDTTVLESGGYNGSGTGTTERAEREG